MLANIFDTDKLGIIFFYNKLRANSGVGKEMAMYAAAKGADVYMVCRSMGRAETARDEIIKKTSSDKVKILQVR